MNHTTKATLAIVGLAVFMITATILVTGHDAFAKKRVSVKIGGTTSETIQAADNSQHCAFGAGATTAVCTNTPSNTQTQTSNAGSTGTG